MIDTSLHNMLTGWSCPRNEVSYDPATMRVHWKCARCTYTAWMPEHIVRYTYKKYGPEPVLQQAHWLFLWDRAEWICPLCAEADGAFKALLKAAKEKPND